MSVYAFPPSFNERKLYIPPYPQCVMYEWWRYVIIKTLVRFGMRPVEGGESCCPRQSSNVDGNHEFWICLDCYIERFASNARHVDFEKTFQAGFENTQEGDPLPKSMMDEVLSALGRKTDTGSIEAGVETSGTTDPPSVAGTEGSDTGGYDTRGSNSETL
jgi:hypothetical protein